MTISIVIARYHENINWSKQFSNVIIYNKGLYITDISQVLLNNVGREGHTYYKHIYDNYDNLTDYIVFLQGNPFDHSPNIIRNLNNYINNTKLNINFEFLSERVLISNLNDCPYHRGLPMRDTYEKIFGERIVNMEFEFGTGAQFIVSKNQILKRPKEFYLKIIKLLEYEVSPIEGFVIERFHKLIFS